MRKTDQYLVNMEIAAPGPARAAAASVRAEQERRNKNVAPAHTGISTAFTLNLSGMKLNTGEKASTTSATARFSPATTRAAMSQMNHSASAMLVVDNR